MTPIMIITECAADLILFFGVITAVSISESGLWQNKRSVAISAILTTIVGMMVYCTIFSQLPMIQWLLIIVNYSKFCISAMIIYKHCSVKLICTSLIIQFLSSLINFAIQMLLPAGFSSLTMLSARMIILAAVVFISIKRRNMYISDLIPSIPKHIYALILASCFFASGLVSTADYATDRPEAKELLIKIFSMAVILCLAAAIISLVTNVFVKAYYLNINILLEKQVQSQINYYIQREKSNTELRRFRHDYINHMDCIKSLLHSEKYDEIHDYLSTLSDTFPGNRFTYNTGNYLADAILCDKQEKAIDQNITIDFDGNITTKINNTDLCTILCNALDNAIEACTDINDERNISVFGGFEHGYFILIIKNPCHKTINTSAPLITTKANKLDHGFGLYNINEAVKKHDGTMNIQNTNSEFVLSLTFNLSDA